MLTKFYPVKCLNDLFVEIPFDEEVLGVYKKVNGNNDESTNSIYEEYALRDPLIRTAFKRFLDSRVLNDTDSEKRAKDEFVLRSGLIYLSDKWSDDAGMKSMFNNIDGVLKRVVKKC